MLSPATAATCAIDVVLLAVAALNKRGIFFWRMDGRANVLSTNAIFKDDECIHDFDLMLA